MLTFGKRVRDYRLAKGLTMEDVCGDESELSVRQLSRIEKGQSSTKLLNVYYLATQLGVSVGELTDGRHQELPRRYLELKYAILRVPTYGDPDRLDLREVQFDEIYNDFYDGLPANEKMLISCMQAKMDVILSRDIEYGVGLLEEYLESVKCKVEYQLEDIALLDLYLSCLSVSDFSPKLYQKETYHKLLRTTLRQIDYLMPDDLIIFNHFLTILSGIAIRLKDYQHFEMLLERGRSIMMKTQDFHLMPIFSLLEWKYALVHLFDTKRATKAYHHAVLYAGMIEDTFLEEKLKLEWENDVIRG